MKTIELKLAEVPATGISTMYYKDLDNYLHFLPVKAVVSEEDGKNVYFVLSSITGKTYFTTQEKTFSSKFISQDQVKDYLKFKTSTIKKTIYDEGETGIDYWSVDDYGNKVFKCETCEASEIYNFHSYCHGCGRKIVVIKS